MAEFKAGTREQVKNGQAQYVAGDIVAKDATVNIGEERRGSRVFKAGTKTRSKSVTVVTGRTDSGKISSSKTILYVEKNGSFQPAAVKKDGEWSYSDPDYPLMQGVASTEVQSALANKNSDLNKVTNNGISAELGKRQDVLPEDRDTILGAKQNHSSPADEPSGLEGKPLNTETVPIEDLPKSQGGGKPDNSAKKGTRNKFGNLKYPLTIGSTNMDVIKFSMLEFSPRKFTKKGGGAGALSDRAVVGKDRKAIGTVVLPIPGAITDQNVAEWGDGRINPLQLAGLEVAGEALSKGIGAAGQSASDLIGKLGNTSEQAKKALAGAISASAVGISADEVLARTQGAVVNPNLELLFKGPSLRPFNFSFQMGARNEQESLEIMRILRFFKQGGSPQRTSAQYLVKAPHTFQIEYLHRGEDGDQNKFLNKIKECALLSVGVNYTPNNNYATFKNGAPVAVELSLAFKELDPVFNDEYGPGDGDVGF
tara:strand:+ start:55 stop:1500 length:1446 start_codon:yes stop_codon:yes gene_type:complete